MAWFFRKEQEIKEVNKTEAINDGEETAGTDAEELIAVLSAAVASVLGTEGDGFVIRSYKRVDLSWRKSGREFQIFHHLGQES